MGKHILTINLWHDRTVNKSWNDQHGDRLVFHICDLNIGFMTFTENKMN